jgi:hypothetical protein
MESAGNGDFDVCQPTSILIILIFRGIEEGAIDRLLDPSNMGYGIGVWFPGLTVLVVNSRVLIEDLGGSNSKCSDSEYCIW